MGETGLRVEPRKRTRNHRRRALDERLQRFLAEQLVQPLRLAARMAHGQQLLEGIRELYGQVHEERRELVPARSAAPESRVDTGTAATSGRCGSASSFE